MIMYMKRALLALAPVLLTVSFWFFAESNRGLLPDPLAIHWGIAGDPDGFGSLNDQLAISILTLFLVGIIWVTLVYLRAIPNSIRVLFLAVVGLLWLMLYGIFNYTLVIQLGLEDPRDARIGNVFSLVLLAIPLTLVPWLLSKPRIDLGQTLSVSYWNIPLFRTNYSEIESAHESKARARDFGGLGIRYANKTTAFMPSSGPALELRLRTGERILIRTDRAPELVREIEQKRSGL
jgi:hypothetical protein